MLLKINVRDSTIQKIDTALLKVFGRSYAIRFPIDPRTELDRIPRCKHMSYEQLEKVAQCSHRDVISACKSINGCTTYDPIKKRYMVYINYSDCDSLSFRRVRWTTAHEIGHIVCGHFIELIEAGAPENIIAWIDVPSLEMTNLVMQEADIILATGGPGMVKAAYSSGKPALGVGAGNTPAIIDDSADIILAVNSIIHSKTFDNGMICASEQSIRFVKPSLSTVRSTRRS